MYELVGVIVGLVLLLAFLKRRQNAGRKLPPQVTSGSIPLIRNYLPAAQFAKNPKVLLDWRKTYGNVFCVDFVFTKMTFVWEKEDKQFFFKAKDSQLTFFGAENNRTFAHKVGEFFIGGRHQLEPGTGHELPMSDIKKQITKIFIDKSSLIEHKRVVLEMLPEFTKRWESMEKFDLFLEASNFVTAVNLQVSLGLEARKEYGLQLAELYRYLEANALKMEYLALPSWVPVPGRAEVIRKREELMKTIAEATKKFLSTEKKDPNNNDIYTYVGYGVDIHQKAGSSAEVILEDASAKVTSLLLAGHINTAGSSGWTLAHLLENPEALKKAIAEADATTLTPEEPIPEVPFIDAAMKETIRLHALRLLTRRVTDRLDLHGYDLDDNYSLAVSPFAVHHDEGLYPDVDKFKPERWMDPAKTTEMTNDRHFIAFGFHDHVCLGMKFAYMVVKTLLVYLFQNYEVSLQNKVGEIDWISQSPGMSFALQPTYAKIVARK